jgi:hypothetical protein
VTKLLAILALDLGVVPRLGALLGEMALLFTVAARDVGGVLGLVALLGHVILRATVVAGALGNVGALMLVNGRLLMCNVANTYVLGEMAGLVAFTALNAFSGARFRALLGVVTLLFAILASVRVKALLRAVASTVTVLFAVHALDGGLRGLVLDSLLGTALENTLETARKRLG